MKQELEDSKRQQAIEKEQKQQLEQELQVKGRELASLALEAVKDKEKSHDEEYWEIFRNNFDLIHQHFFRNLRKQYPTLTTNDLRFCAYLRLNLSTKDIASLTGLSIRGVEGARYRLRKKLNLQEGTDLSTFLIDFK
jgi:DNA-binding CsgD family transcriptional regulator